MRDQLDRLTEYHGSEVYENPEGLIRAARRALGGVDYDTMVGRGLSGALIIPQMARSLEKDWVIIRKPDAGSHSTWSLLSGRLGQRWIFVDDFVGLGDTRLQVFDAIRHDVQRHNRNVYVEADKFETTWVGQYLYTRDAFSPASDFDGFPTIFR